MEIKDWITVGIASYAAILSTIIAILDFIRAKNHLTITFAINKFSNTNRVIITNSGDRPLTIVDFIVGIQHHYLDDTGNEYWDTVNLYLPDENFKLPILLKNGETIVSKSLSELTKEMIYSLENKKKFILEVIDSEGKIYRRYKLKYDKEVVMS